MVDGHNIWRTNLDAALATLKAIEALGATVAVSTSTSLFHVPHTLKGEEHLGEELLSWLAFADEKVAEIATLATALNEGEDAAADALAAARAALASRKAHPGTNRADVRDALAAVTPQDFARSDYSVRAAAQANRFHLPELATTTIGSFPQTPEIRKARAAWAKGALSDADYEAAMKAEIASVVKMQEDLGLDVLVHGEAERNDMVQYFAELLEGFDVTVNGWVQSYGSRCTRPSILWGDVARPEPMTVRWAQYAQSLSDKPVKGMLTGPVTILAWSFVRDDQPMGVTANQVALALRQEIADLEEAGIGIIQVDEPALRELLPLKNADKAAYLDWSVNSFKLVHGGRQGRHPGAHAPVLLGVWRDHRRDRRPGRRRHVDRGGAFAHGGAAGDSRARLCARHRPGRVGHPQPPRSVDRRDHGTADARQGLDPRHAAVGQP